MRSTQRQVGALLGVAALSVGMVAATAPTAGAAVSTDAVIAEVYGGGGNSGATLTQDFIELGNRSSAAVDLTGWSVQYLPASPSPTSRWQVTPLTGSLAAGARQARLTISPGRINPTSDAWENSRKPLVGEFRFLGRPVFVVTNHFNSKGGDQPLDGRFQPPNRILYAQN